MATTLRPRATLARVGDAAARFASFDRSTQTRLRDFATSLARARGMSAIRDPEESFSRHVLDSLALLPTMEKHLDVSHARLVDVGCGPGLPGLVLAVAKPEWKFTMMDDKPKGSPLCKTMMDAQAKRIAFVQESAHKLQLNNIQAVQARAESFGREEEHREAYDAAVARAVADTRVLAELCLPLVRVGGYVFAAKGVEPHDEIQNARGAVELLGGHVHDVAEVDSQCEQGARTVVVIGKIQTTPEKYPRREGIPNKRPL
eukprot:CAMPEP_0113930908 /NCGR_PEP_ID=MMETSP1159-20121227/6227_1 /TAXON_ID=88271 /ORGANISM="Picocystis salinarum" /LENGTH=258 /DNA_ID=CAMNT_0000931775 /DNA_START=503 /DNA_END=1280 /DNA_ORIENTATION=- /assembly_acc=CAM_ASM_000767